MLNTPEIPVSATGVIHGEILTRPWVVSMILDLSGYSASCDLTKLKIVEPAAGTGAFLSEIVDRLLSSAMRCGIKVTASSVGQAIRAFEIQEENCQSLRDLVFRKLVTSGVSTRAAEEISWIWIVHDDYLIPNKDHVVRDVDVVVGNPPYIRMEDIPKSQATEYRSRYTTMTGRADIYVAFFEAGLSTLSPDGRLSYICSDRWMRNEYGKSLRKYITSGNIGIDAIITTHDADMFQTKVDAYPAIVVLRHGPQSAVLVADTTAKFSYREAPRLVSAIKRHRPMVAPTFTLGLVPNWVTQAGDPWPHGSPAVIERLSALEVLPTIEGTGAKIGIGIATGADAVYITNPKRPLPEVESDRLLPLAHADDIRTGTWNWTGRYLVSPWRSDGLIQIDEYPMMRQYLLSHDNVKVRNVAQRNPASWWRTIDRVAFRLINRRLILMQDMSQQVTPVVSPPGFYPHHNLYWIDVQDSGWDPEVLAGILLSDQVREQIAARCVLMRGKTLRLQAQYLRQIHIPPPTAITKAKAKVFQSAYRHMDRLEATEALNSLLPL